MSNETSTSSPEEIFLDNTMDMGLSLAELTQALPWSILLLLFWVWYRKSEDMQNWAFDFFADRLGNPDDHLDLEIHPDETGDADRFLTSYRHVIDEMSLRVRSEYLGWRGLVASLVLYMDRRGPEIRRDVRILGIYVVLVEFLICLRALTVIQLFRSLMIFTALLLVSYGLVIQKNEGKSSVEMSLAVLLCKATLTAYIDFVFCLYRILRIDDILPQHEYQIVLRNFPLFFRILINVGPFQMAFDHILTEFLTGFGDEITA